MTAASSLKGAGTRLSILQIEDNRADAELELVELSKAGFEVSADVAETYEDVASYLTAKSYDVVLADYRLPGWVGVDALPLARQLQPDIPFILVTGTLGDAVAVECVKNGVTDFVLKSQLSRLPMAVERAFREKSLSEQRNRALKELAESETKFRDLVEISPDAIIVHQEGKIVFCNRANLTLLGAQTPEQIIGKPISELIHPDQLKQVVDQIKIDDEQGHASPPREIVLVRLDGSLVYVETIGIPTTWKGSRAREVILRDITQRKKAEQAVLEGRKLLKLAERASLPIGLWEWNPGTAQLSWSREVFRQLGYTRDIVPSSEHFLDRIHPEDRPRVETAIQAVVSGHRRIYEVQFRVVLPDGTVRWLDSRAVMAHDESSRMIGITIDITKLRRSEKSYRSIIETAPLGVYRANSAGHFVMANPALVKILGYSSESEVLLLDIHRDVYVHPEQRLAVVRRVIENGYAKDVEVEWKRKDGRIVSVRLKVVLVHKESGEGGLFQGFVEDVTEGKTLRNQYWQAQKMEAVGRLAGGVAHDFNNMLMVFGSYAELIKQRKVNDAKVNRYADQIHTTAGRGASVTRQLLAFSRQQVLNPEVLDLNVVVSELDKVLPQMLGEDIAVVTRLDPALRRVRVDRGQMEQIIMNLAVNSRDAMPKGGRFEIETQNIELDATYAAEHSPMSAGTYVRLSVVDTGVGMDPETQSHIFEPFFTTKERGKGTGLGLATAYGIVKQSGGFIWVSSGVGRGTKFDIFFPPIEETTTKDLTPFVSSPTSAEAETILLVEDEEALREAACEFLQSRGYTVLVASDGTEAERICEQRNGAIDLMLTDLVMPGMDGIELSKVVTARYPAMRIIYMSGYVDRSIEGLSPGAVLLKKPFTLSALASTLRTVLESRAPGNN